MIGEEKYLCGNIFVQKKDVFVLKEKKRFQFNIANQAFKNGFVSLFWYYNIEVINLASGGVAICLPQNLSQKELNRLFQNFPIVISQSIPFLGTGIYFVRTTNVD